MIVLLHGADTFSSTTRLRELRRELDPHGFNTVVLDAADASVGTLRAACDTNALFGGTRYVEARGLLSRWLGGKRGGKKGGGTEPLADLLAYLPTLPPTTHLVCWEPAAVALPPPLEAELRRQGATVSLFEAPVGQALRQWVEARAARLGAEIDPPAIVALLEATCPTGWREAPRARDARPPDLARIDNELAKLATAVLGSRVGSRITARVVAALVVGEQATNIFALTNAVSARDGAAAIGWLRSLLDQGVAPEALLAQLARQLLVLDRWRVEQEAPATGAARPPAAGRSQGQARHLERQLRALGGERVARGVELALEADLAVKSGRARNAEEALYWLVLELCEVGAAGPRLAEELAVS